MQRRTPLLLGMTLVLVLIALVPFALNAPSLTPEVFGVTATRYAEVEGQFLTQDYEIELSATTIFVTIPFEAEPLPGDPDYTPPASSNNTDSSSVVTRINAQVEAPSQQDTSTMDLPIFSCPQPDAAIGATWLASTPFVLLGYTGDENGTLYLRIAQNADAPPLWVQVIDPGVLNLAVDYTESPFITDCAGTIDGEPAESDAAFDPQNPPIPQIRTATPLPRVERELNITNEDAQTQLAERVPELSNPVVTIAEDNITITGIIDIQAALITLQGNVEIVGTLASFVNDNGLTKLQMTVETLTVSGRDYTGTDESAEVELAVNNWFISLLRGRDVQSFTQSADLLQILVLEDPELSEAAETTAEVLPTLDPDVTPSATPTFTRRTAVPTATLNLQPVTATPRIRTPLPTIDPNRPTATVPADSADTTTGDGPRTVDNGDAAQSLGNLGIDGVISPFALFQQDGLQVQGALPGQGRFVLDGLLTVVDGQVQFDPQALEITGLGGLSAEVPVDQFPLLVPAINTWLAAFLGNEVESISTDSGAMVINPDQ